MLFGQYGTDPVVLKMSVLVICLVKLHISHWFLLICLTHSYSPPHSYFSFLFPLSPWILARVQ